METSSLAQSMEGRSKSVLDEARKAEAAEQATLVRRLQQRDPQAMEEVYDRYAGLVFAQISRLVRSRPAAEDLLQETFLRVWNRVHSYDGARGSLGVWIATVARNLTIDYIRSVDARMAENSSGLEQIERTAPAGAFENEILQLERVRELTRALGVLNRNQRLVVRLAFHDGLSHSEIAARLQRPLGTVKSWVRTALTAMRQQLLAGPFTGPGRRLLADAEFGSQQLDGKLAQ